MTNRVRVNLVNPQELLEIPGLSEAEVDTIIRFRREHGPIENEQQLGTILGGRPKGVEPWVDPVPWIRQSEIVGGVGGQHPPTASPLISCAESPARPS